MTEEIVQHVVRNSVQQLLWVVRRIEKLQKESKELENVIFVLCDVAGRLERMLEDEKAK